MSALRILAARRTAAMTDALYPVSVRVQDERSEIVGVEVRAQPWGSVVSPSRCEPGTIEQHDRRPIPRAERPMPLAAHTLVAD